MQLPWRSRRTLTALLAEGAVEVNGHPVTKKARRLNPGDVVALRVPVSPDADVDLGAIPLTILYEDDELVLVDKPGDLAVHPASTCQHRNLLRRLEHHYTHEQPDPTVEPSVLHRLDRTTSGVVAFAKRRALIASYTAQFAARTTEKDYIAIVHGRMQGEHRIEHPIHTPPQRPVHVGPGGKPSRTDVRVLESTSVASRLTIALHTGRKHQIRVHLAAEGHPLVYDEIYGAPHGDDWPADARPLLHAARLRLDHRDGRRLSVESPVPAELERAWSALSSSAR